MSEKISLDSSVDRILFHEVKFKMVLTELS